MQRSAGLFTGLDTVLLRVRKLDEARAWYERTLGFSATYDDPNEGLVIFDLGGTTTLTLWQLKPGDRPPPPASATGFPIFGAADAKAAHAALKARGVEAGAIQEGPGVRYFGFLDPDGNRLEVCELVPE